MGNVLLWRKSILLYNWYRKPKTNKKWIWDVTYKTFWLLFVLFLQACWWEYFRRLQTQTQTLCHLGSSLGKGHREGFIQPLLEIFSSCKGLPSYKTSSLLIAALYHRNQIKCFVLQATFGPYFTPKPVFTMKNIKNISSWAGKIFCPISSFLTEVWQKSFECQEMGRGLGWMGIYTPFLLLLHCLFHLP